MKDQHYICSVKDTTNDYVVIQQAYCDVSTANKAAKEFKAMECIAQYLGKPDRYHVSFTQNPIDLNTV